MWTMWIMRLTALRKAAWGTCKSYGCSNRYEPRHGCQCNSHGSEFSTAHHVSCVSCNRNRNWQAIIALACSQYFTIRIDFSFPLLVSLKCSLHNSDLSEGSCLFHVIIVFPVLRQVRKIWQLLLRHRHLLRGQPSQPTSCSSCKAIGKDLWTSRPLQGESREKKHMLDEGNV